ncbi:MAG: phospho-N-acetylmuramoyl-pentapeptide-transferase, partial [Actinobacteria bacterium RBG_19FT_COMBO_36_27]
MTPFFIRFQKNKKIGERIRIDGPKTHSAKAGTPTMGGLVFVLSSMVAFTIVSLIKYYRHEVYSVEGIFIMSVLLLCSFIGFIDDYIALKMQRSLGLRWWVKISLLAVVCIYFILFSKYILNTGTYLNIPLTNIKIEMGNWYYTIVVLIIISTTNAVNLTDGLDGLATGASSIVLAVFSFIAFLEWSVPDVSVSYAVDVAVVSGGTLAACIGFLWWNTAPAEIFMGDTGSFGLGGLIAAVAIILKQEILLIVIGGLFVIEALSVIIQVLW